MFSRSIFPAPATAAALVFIPAAARACSVCFGQGSGDLQRGFYWGILLLLLLPLVLVASIAAMIVHTQRRKEAALKAAGPHAA